MNILFPELLRFSDVGLLLLRLMVAVVFLPSGLNHLKHSAERAKSIGVSRGFTIVLGSGEVLGSLGVALGALIQLADRIDPDHARGDPEEDLRLEDRFLGEGRIRLALRPDAPGDEPRDSRDGGRQPRRAFQLGRAGVLSRSALA